ncbi:MAG: glycosyltransferase [Candidatus Eisenbacteria bacterium]|nr:glycosyltransferase [Candidatus Eisenbacteria bacterium]
MNALDPADAVTRHLLELDETLRREGHETAIFSRHVHHDLAGISRPIEELRGAEGDLLLFHYAGYSTLLGAVAQFPGRRGVVYHNVTPPRFFDGMEETRVFCEKGRLQLPSLPRIFHFGIGVSEYNRRELEDAGFEHAFVLPVSYQVSPMMEGEPAPSVVGRYEGGRNILMIGRLAPHKGILEGVRAFDHLTREHPGDWRLFLVGRTRGYEPYLRRVRREIRARGLENRVVLTGEVSSGEVRGYYAVASALLVLSEHEGFCVPILEAMRLGVPVVAYGAAAIPETAGEAALLLSDREEATVAEALARAVLDPPFRDDLIGKGFDRSEKFTSESITARLRDILEKTRILPAPAEPAPAPRFSVVVCTYNRARTLGACLEALGHLDYPEYEIVVVNGPSTDGTDAVLSRFPGVKRVDNPERNLSVSRNLGIAASAGEIVALLDDDALPDTDWLDRLAEPYVDVTVGAVGGKVFGPGGDHLQFNNGIITRFGMPVAIREEPGDFNLPDGDRFNIMMGTNASFRRSALDDVGGFDENYEYYHDESDLCVRVIRAGHRVVHAPEARVWHEFEKSHVRVALHDVNWRVVAKNTIYFFFKNNRWYARPFDCLQPLRAVLVLLGSFTRWYLRGEIGGGLFLRSFGRWMAGVALGYGKGFFRRPRRFLARRAGGGGAVFLPAGRTRPRYGARRFHVALVSQQYPPDPCGGIGVYTEQLARGLVGAGHAVTVVARGDRISTVWRDGVKVVRVPDEVVKARRLPLTHRVSRKNLARAFAVQRALRRAHRQRRIDLVEAPVWDAEAFVTAVDGSLPLVIRLNTPMAVALETQGWRPTEDVRLACDMEWAMLERARGWVDTSGTIAGMLRNRFGVRGADVLVREIPFGVTARQARPEANEASGGDGSIHALFVGRLEPRKGIDTLLAAARKALAENPRLHLVLAGSIPDRTMAWRFFRSCGVPDARDRVRFLGRVGDAALQKLYAECDFFVAPSRYESFGIVYLEAMAHGKPVVACSAGGPARLVRDGETGLLVPPDDPEALAAAMLRLAGDRSLRLRLGVEAWRMTREEYDPEGMVRRSVEFYEEILAAAGKRKSTAEDPPPRARAPLHPSSPAAGG